MLSGQLAAQHTTAAPRYFPPPAHEHNMTTGGLTDLQTMKSLKLFHVNMYQFLIRGGRGTNNADVSLFAPIKGCTTECGREKNKTLQDMGDVKDTDDDVSRDIVHYVYFTAFCKDMKGRAVKKIPGSERILTSVEQNILHHYL